MLLEGETPVRLGGRALEILTALVERPGEIVGKNELVARVWPNMVIDESALRVHIAGLRRALGDGQPGRRYLASVPGRGYRFVAPVRFAHQETPASLQPAATAAHNLPMSRGRPLGRDETIATLEEQIRQQRLITLVGAGGIGKTTVALSLAEALLPAFGDGVRLVDLAPLDDPRFVPSAFETALGLASNSDSASARLTDFLKSKQMLVIFDNCEHVIEAAAALAEQVMAVAPGVRILATSREPLRAVGERVHRLHPLAFPADPSGICATDALTFPAVQLFVERATAILDGFELSDSDAPIVSDICRKLGGVALAIELAAARVDAFGVRQLAALLNDRFRILNQGTRTAQPRHQSLTAMLDWSYEYLTETERRVLRRLSVFAGAFALEAAVAVAGDDDTDVVEAIANLVAKSLVSADVGGTIVSYRLLDTTRAYALSKLVTSGELDWASRHHAVFCLHWLRASEADWIALSTAEWLKLCRSQIDDQRAALAWAFSSSGDCSLGIALAIAATPVWFELTLIDECRTQVALALACDTSPLQRMQLLGIQTWAAPGAPNGIGAERIANLLELIDLATELRDQDYQLLALWALWGSYIVVGQKAKSLEYALTFQSIAATLDDPRYLAHAHLMLATLKFDGGDFLAAEEQIAEFSACKPSTVVRVPVINRRLRQHRLERTVSALTAFMRGFLDQALVIEDDNFSQAFAVDHALLQVNTLSQSSCLVALYIGDLERSERFVKHLVEVSEAHGLTIGSTEAQCYEAMLTDLRGDTSLGAAKLRAAIENRPRRGYLHHVPLFLSYLAERLGEGGACADGLATIQEALSAAEERDDQWHLAEIARVRAGLSVKMGHISAAESDLLYAIDLARRQGALFWELRAAQDFAELRRAQGRPAEGRELLSAVYGAFTEGFDKPALRRARTLLHNIY